MKTFLTLALTPALAGVLALSAQDRQDERVQHLTPLPTPQQGAEADPNAATFDAEALKQGLRASTLEERERSYEELLRAARRDSAALQALHDWAADASDLELAWTAKLALRELSLRRDPFGGFHGGMRGGDGFPFQFDPDHFGDPFAGAFPDLSRRFEDLQRDIERMMQGMGRMQPSPGALRLERSGSQRFELESGPDGVKVRVHEDVDGKQETKEYEAKSLEELLDTYPELRGRIQVSPGWSGDSQEQLEDMLGRLRESPFGAWPSPMTGIPTDRLGVQVREPGSFEAPAGVEPGTGLFVDQTLPGTIAAEVGLQPGDVVLEVCGEKVASAVEARAALAARRPDEPVVLKIVDALGATRTLTWKPGDASGAPGAPQPLRRF